ncbi:hypothetical protein KIW84_056049 [Lathyrus oleraceus]|uniref:ABC transporter domain-containing protein n=1 Tax=Pisum sativum TaxID=3888 RepID=A0A9D5AJ69_PEA|nr:hypothetical protein KIW84_056049 [Pisum sativum]
MLGRQLDAATVFTCLALFNTLISPLNSFPWVINGLIDAIISSRRLSRFLSCSEHRRKVGENISCSSSSLSVQPDSLHDLAVSIQDACCSWSSSDEKALNMVLNHVTLSLSKGFLCCSYWRAYVPQVPWILSGTVRDNILFGKSYHPERYTDTVKACALDVDISLMAGGGMAYIGEKEVNLSGGQRARLALARVLYHDSDVIMLDDVLSAVDVQVARWILHNAILAFSPLNEMDSTSHNHQQTQDTPNIATVWSRINKPHVKPAQQHDYQTCIKTTVNSQQENCRLNALELPSDRTRIWSDLSATAVKNTSAMEERQAQERTTLNDNEQREIQKISAVQISRGKLAAGNNPRDSNFCLPTENDHLIGVSVAGLEAEFQPVVNYLLPHILSHKQDPHDMHLQLLQDMTSRGSFYPILHVANGRTTSKHPGNITDSEVYKSSQLSPALTVSSNFEPRRSRSASSFNLSAYRSMVLRPDAIFMLLRKAYKDCDLSSVCRMASRIMQKLIDPEQNVSYPQNELTGPSEEKSKLELTSLCTLVDYSNLFGEKFRMPDEHWDFSYLNLSPFLCSKMAERISEFWAALPPVQALLPALRPLLSNSFDVVDNSFSQWNQPIIQQDMFNSNASYNGEIEVYLTLAPCNSHNKSRQATMPY